MAKPSPSSLRNILNFFERFQSAINLHNYTRQQAIWKSPSICKSLPCKTVHDILYKISMYNNVSTEFLHFGHHTSDGIAIRYELEGPPCWEQIFSFLHIHPHLCWGPPSLLHNRYRGSFPGVKRPERRFDHLPQI